MHTTTLWTNLMAMWPDMKIKKLKWYPCSTEFVRLGLVIKRIYKAIKKNHPICCSQYKLWVQTGLVKGYSITMRAMSGYRTTTTLKKRYRVLAFTTLQDYVHIHMARREKHQMMPHECCAGKPCFSKWGWLGWHNGETNETQMKLVRCNTLLLLLNYCS